MNEFGRHLLPNRDRLGFESTIGAVADAIRRHKDGRFNVGVYGKWGSGKSGFLALLEKALNDRSHPDFEEFTFVHFSAWRFRKPADAAVALVNAMMADSQDFVAELKNLLKRDTKAVVKAVVNFFLRGIGTDVIETLTDEEKRQHRERYGGLLEERYFFHEAIAEAFGGLKVPVVVIIDDLDRCLHKETVDILEAMKTVFDVPNCIFVIAADPVRTCKAIEAVRSKSEAHRYLDKIIQLPVNVPSIRKDADLLNDFLKDHIRLSWLQEKADATEEHEPNEQIGSY